MKHITEKYRQPCNIMESTYEEYSMMSEFLKPYGIETRTISYWREDGIAMCTWQVRNTYKVFCFSGLKGEAISKLAEEHMASGTWRR